MTEKNKKWLKEGKELSREFPQGQRVYSSEGISSALASQAGGLGAKTGLYAIDTKRQGNPRFTENVATFGANDYKEPKMVSDGMKIRRLTPKECERLQGFPDNFTEGLSDTQRYKTLGNAITVNVVQAIAERLL